MEMSERLCREGLHHKLDIQDYGKPKTFGLLEAPDELELRFIDDMLVINDEPVTEGELAGLLHQLGLSGLPRCHKIFDLKWWADPSYYKAKS